MTSFSRFRPTDRPGQPLQVLSDWDVPYTSELSLDVFYPDADGPWPVAVVLHGGEDHKATMTDFAKAVSQQGLVAFVPEWRSYPAQLEENRLAALEDVACAVRFARERAGDYGGDGERVVMAGWSLGGNFGALAVLRRQSVEGDCLGDREVSPRAQGLVGLDGAYDFTEIIMERVRADEEPGNAATTSDPPVLRWTMDEMNEISAHSCVEPHERENPPAFRLFTGEIEQLHAQAERFRDDLVSAGFEVELVRHPELSHEAVVLAPGTVEAVVELAYK